MKIRYEGIILLVLGFSCGIPVSADSHGHFPGIGSRAAYSKAAEFLMQGALRADKRDFQGAIPFYKKAISIYPYDSASYQNLALSLKELGKYNEAIPLYKKALDLDPNYLSAWLGSAESNWESNNLSEAEKCYRKAVAVAPDSYEAVGSLGDLLREQGKFKEARIWLVRAKSCPKCKDFPGEIEKALKRCDDEEKKAQLKEASH